MKRAILLLAVALMATATLAACQTATPEAEVPPEGVTTEGTSAVAEQPVSTTTRTGAWVDKVIVSEEPSQDAGVQRLAAGDLDVYAQTISSASTFDAIQSNPDLKYKTSYGSYNEITYNPSACADTTKLNPFAVPKIREATNYMVDRKKIVDEFMGGMGTPRWVAIPSASADRGIMADFIRQMEAKYAYNPETATTIITEEMEKLGATKGADGKWMFEGSPVSLIGLIRTEDERKQIGDYYATLLEDQGFAVERQYKTAAEAGPIWQQSDPTECLFNYYTGGWITTAVSRDSGSNFNAFYTPKVYTQPLFQAYTPTEEFSAVAQRLNDNDFTTLQERRDLFGQVLPMSMEDSVRIWLLDRTSAAPYRKEVEVAADLSGSISGSLLWPYTLRFVDKEGGEVRWASASILSDPWNPVGGTNWIFDTALIRATGEQAYVIDPNTGLVWPNRVASMAVTVKQGLPVNKSLDWLTLDFAPEIVVPGDAWTDWDAKTQTFVTAADYFTATDTVTALLKTVVTYPPDIFEKTKWQDGSPFTMGDMMMSLIMNFDSAKPDSAIYDEATVPSYQAFMGTFKGIKIASQDPLTIEYYTDSWQLDAENSLGNFNALWPGYGFGEAPWHTIALGVMGEAAGEAAFTQDKATNKEVEWYSYIAGPTLEVLSKQLADATANASIPYSPTLGAYITADEIATRYANLKTWFDARGHYWVGTGPFYLETVAPVEGSRTVGAAGGWFVESSYTVK